jgi:Zn-dependent peptidase ImmA (M78 family)
MKKKNAGYVLIPEEELRKLYYEDFLSIKKIAEQYYVSHVTVINRMKEFNLEKRNGYSTAEKRKKVTNYESSE